ncbi:histidine phosphatase family protein [Acidocella aminolytica]|jgi:broad specificity phosphatase PhoE|uniref:Phosphoglycerate mutase n=1 Tax=Acidocella aminolytica 101 = DSM 11237 TaxID=1120923 RepID=A0A0D6PHW2_9PROT|nr:histidine phosphatase family protein [Acidocella aminolytica]GAN81360.1 phosphoglycerate mutase [Acidocella aminolytica 101 = DSM 11237]GBQ33592.1 fructose-2,6-bisphosphatase [Acidocella aminolytica 101 = DSM 11237]SHF42966.1 Broad specificity phosphatase PhoE [Acidocella aminolytica 101 = DSM 11237]
MFLLRHGQSYFNLHFTETRRDPGIEDPELTPRGHEQAHAAAETLMDARITRVIVSPYTRALQTAEPFLCRPGIRVEVRDEVRERCAFSCDIGSPPDRLADRFPHHEFGHLPERWWHEAVESEAEVEARARTFHEFVQELDDADSTLVVSHWGFILALTGQSLANGEWIAFDPAMAAPERVSWQY